MLRACSLDFKRSWDNHLPLVELRTTTATMLTLEWNLIKHYMVEHVDHLLFGMKRERKKQLGPEFVQQTTQSIEKIHKRLVAAQYKQKKYADFGRKEKTFEVGAKKILLKVSPWKGIVRFGKRRN